MSVRRWVGWAVAVVAIGGAGRFVYKTGALSPERAAPPKPTPTVRAKLGDVAETVLATGSVSPVDETSIRAEVSGLVTAVQVVPGQRVKRDDPLVQLDRKALESEVHEGEFQIEADQLRAEQARKKLDRDRSLVGKGFIPQEEYDDADTALRLAQNDLSVQRAKLETLRQKIVKTDIRAPHDGVVLKLEARPGQVIIGADSVTSGTVLMKVADLGRLKVETTLNEVDVARVRTGSKVKLTFDALPGRTVPGTVTYISPSADDGSGGGGDDGGSSGRRGSSSSSGSGGTRGFETIINLDEADDRIRPGVTAHVEVPVAKATKVVTVPLTGLFSEGEKLVAFVKHGETFERKEVDAGISDGTTVEVKKGLSDKDEVATERPAGMEGPKKAEEN